MKKQIPNAITLLNLVAGCMAIASAFDGDFGGVVLWVVMAAIFDFADGFAARVLHAPSGIGKELDSLADGVSFGVAPAMVVFVLLRDHTSYPPFLSPVEPYIPFCAFAIAAVSALRLARFNLDTRQADSFIGLPTPANALFWISYCYGLRNATCQNEIFACITLVLIPILSALMVAGIPMFSLKLKKIAFRGNEKPIVLAAVMAAFVAVMGIPGIAPGILAYIAMSTASLFLSRRRNR